MGEGRITGEALAAELGVSVSTVISDAIVAGLGARGGPYTPAQAEAIRRVRRERRGRITQRVLATELGVDPATVGREAGRLGFAGRRGYTPEQAEAIRRGVAAGRRRRSGPFGAR